MIVTLHHNKNIDAKNNNDRHILHQRPRVSRANDAPNPRLHKTQVKSWQLDVVFLLNENEGEEAVDEVNIEDLNESFENLEIPEEEVPGNAELDQFFKHYF